MMTREEFYEYVKGHIKELLPEDAYPKGTTVRIEEVEKSGGLKLTGVCIRKPEETIVPVVYLDEYYKVYQEGAPISLVLEEIKNVDGRAREKINVPRLTEDDLEFDSVRDRIFIKACDKGLSKDYLQKMPHVDQGDYAATYHIMVGISDSGMQSIPVSSMLAAKWGKKPEELHCAALENMRKNLQPEMFEMTSMLENPLFPKETPNLLDGNAESHISEGPEITLYVLRYDTEYFGASCVFDPDIMEQAAKKLGASCFVLPSSNHEILLVKDRGMDIYENLGRMVREINRTELNPEDFLSDHVQYYDKSQKKVLGEKEYLETRAEKVVAAEKKREQKQNSPKI